MKPKLRMTAGLLLAVAFTAAQAAPPWAEGEGKHKDKGVSHSADKKTKLRGDRFYEDDRLIVRRFYEEHPSRLPPGLAKRGGNLPPGLAKRGGNLPPGLAKNEVVPRELEVHLLPLPQELEIRLPPPPHEVIRRILGRDLVLIHKHTNKVLDVLRDALP